MTIPAELSQVARTLTYSGDGETAKVGIGTTVDITGGLAIKGVQVISAAGIWQGSAAGIQGTQGIQGIEGIAGTQGTQGIQGSQGIQGTQGIQGILGTQGIQGSQGIQGTQGIQGATGSQGTSGAQGTQGTTGTGTQGIQGISGTATFPTTVQIQSTKANDTATGGGQIYLNGATGNRIDFNQNGVAAPAFTTRSTGTKLVLYPAISGSQVDYALGIDSSTFWYSIPETTSHQFRWYAGTTNIATLTGAGNFSVTGNVTAYSSDKRLKENFKHIESPLEKVQKLNGYTFDWNKKSEELGFTPQYRKNDVGLIAQEVQEVLPQAAVLAPFDRQIDENGKTISKSGDNYLTIQYERLIPLLIEAIKEQQNQIVSLNSEIEKMKEGN
jgi:hypothetical protein